MSAILYQGQNLVQRYGAREALRLEHLAVNAGETVLLTGPNGCGKSTLLRLLAFLERPASGSLHYAGAADGRQEATLLLQDPYLLRMSVFNNVVLGLRLRHNTAALRQAYERSMSAAGFTEPWNFAERGPRELSGGERQRVALAARLALRPKVLLLDEPTANVDAASARAIALAVKNSTAEGITVVCATHDPALLRALDAREIKLGSSWDMAACASSS